MSDVFEALKKRAQIIRAEAGDPNKGTKSTDHNPAKANGNGGQSKDGDCLEK